MKNLSYHFSTCYAYSVKEPIGELNLKRALDEDTGVGIYIPYNVAPKVSAFLRRDVNKGFAEVTGDKVNRGAGYGQEVPCTYRLYGPRAHIDKMKKFVDPVRSAGHL